MHAITPDGPLVEYDEDNKPADRIEWNGDTPHPANHPGELLTCETIWRASSSSGDYHDNMNSEMFLKWVEEALIPTFERLYPEKEMILMCDNAPYHHKRELDSFSSKTKKELVALGLALRCTSIQLPLTKDRHNKLIDMDTIDNVVAAPDGQYCEVTFDPTTFVARASAINPFIPSSDELKRGLLWYIATNHPELLECKVEKVMRKNKHSILWTPAYTPELQPIEMFWAAGKNYVAEKASFNTTCREVVERLRVGWYGNEELFEDNESNNPNIERPYDETIHYPADCGALFRHCIDDANKKFIPQCEGLSGTMDELIIDANYKRVTEGIPVDVLVMDLVAKNAEGGSAI
jgi:hypothetical protein